MSTEFNHPLVHANNTWAASANLPSQHTDSDGSGATPRAQPDISGATYVGGGRRMFAECRGHGSPTVVLIAGKGNGAA